MPLSPKVEVRDQGGIHGHSWFAKEDIKEGEWIWKKREDGAPHTDVFLTYEQVNALSEEKRNAFLALAYQVDDNTLCGFDPEREPIYEELIENYVNHCCDGNIWYQNDDLMVAMRDIKKGEEICYDYALTENNPQFEIPKCLCGKSRCRGRISGNDWKLPQLQQRYGRHFMSHVLKSIDQLNGQISSSSSSSSSPSSSSSSSSSVSLLSVKVSFGDRVLRFRLPPSALTLAHLRSRLSQRWAFNSSFTSNGDAHPCRASLSYEDDESDMVELESEEDMEEALRITKENERALMKINLVVNDGRQPNKIASTKTGGEKSVASEQKTVVPASPTLLSALPAAASASSSDFTLLSMQLSPPIETTLHGEFRAHRSDGSAASFTIPASLTLRRVGRHVYWSMPCGEAINLPHHHPAVAYFHFSQQCPVEYCAGLQHLPHPFCIRYDHKLVAACLWIHVAYDRGIDFGLVNGSLFEPGSDIRLYDQSGTWMLP